MSKMSDKDSKCERDDPWVFSPRRIVSGKNAAKRFWDLLVWSTMVQLHGSAPPECEGVMEFSGWFILKLS